MELLIKTRSLRHWLMLLHARTDLARPNEASNTYRLRSVSYLHSRCGYSVFHSFQTPNTLPSIHPTCDTGQKLCLDELVLIDLPSIKSSHVSRYKPFLVTWSYVTILAWAGGTGLPGHGSLFRDGSGKNSRRPARLRRRRRRRRWRYPSRAWLIVPPPPAAGDAAAACDLLITFRDHVHHV